MAHGIDDCRVFNGSGNQMFPGTLVRHGNAPKRKIIALRPAGREHDFLRLHLEKLGKCLFCFFYILLCRNAFGMHGRWVAIVFAHYLLYQFPYAVICPGSRGVV